MPIRKEEATTIPMDSPRNAGDPIRMYIQEVKVAAKKRLIFA